MLRLPSSWSLEQRLLARREVNPETGCWEWQGYRDPNGYGRVQWPTLTAETLVHRIALVVFTGDPGDLCALHKCDNPSCFNPEHLYLGTKADNYADMVERGHPVLPPPATATQRARGERHGNSRLTAEQVAAIRADCRSGREVALAYGICPSTVSRVRRGTAWTHLPLEKEAV
jgi:hypothetical protein